MSYTGQDLINQFRETYNDLSDARILELANEVDTEVLAAIPLRKDVDYVAMVEGQSQYVMAEEVVEVGELQFVYNETSRSKPLKFVSLDFMKEEFPGFRFHSEGLPTMAMMNQNSSQGILELYRTPNFSTLVVSNASNATPIVITTTTNHGLQTGDTIVVQEVGGNTAANGYWTVTYITNTTFSLDGSVGNGAYTSGGLVGKSGAGVLRVDSVKRTVITTGVTLPITVQVYSMYVNGMCYKWASRKHKNDIQLFSALWERDLAASSKLARERADNMPVSMLGFKQRRNFRVPGMRGSRQFPGDIVD